MQITEVRFRLPPPEHSNPKYLGVAAVVIDGKLAIHDIRLIWNRDRALVAMPSRKLYSHCSRCHEKVSLDQKYCGECGIRLPEQTVVLNGGVDTSNPGRNRESGIHRDLVHPICSELRELIVRAVYSAYLEQLEHRGREH